MMKLFLNPCLEKLQLRIILMHANYKCFDEQVNISCMYFLLSSKSSSRAL